MQFDLIVTRLNKTTKKRVIFNLSFVVVDFNRCETKTINNYLLYKCLANFDKQF